MTAKWTKKKNALAKRGETSVFNFTVNMQIWDILVSLSSRLLQLPMLSSWLAPPKCSTVGIRLSEAENYCGTLQYFGHPIAHEQLRLSYVYKASIRFGLFRVQNIFAEVLYYFFPDTFKKCSKYLKKK